MEIRKVEQINKLLIEQYNRVNTQINKASNEADISKLLETKANLLSTMNDVQIDLLMKDEVSLYDKNGKIINPKVDPEMLTKDGVREEVNQNLVSPPLINPNHQQSASNEDRTGKAEYFSAVFNLARTVFPIGEQVVSTKNINKDRFRVLGLFAIALVILILFFFLIIK